MAFGRRPTTPQRAPQDSAYRGQPQQDRTPLVYLTGLWDNRSGRGISGSIRLTYAGPDGVTTGEQLTQLIQDATEANVPIRLIIFENDGNHGGGTMQYKAYLALGQPARENGAAPPDRTPRQAPGQWDRPPQEPAYVPPPPFAGQPTEDTQGEIDETPEPAPRPRRPLPRR